MKRLLIAGYGDVARRALPQLALRFEVQPLVRAEGHDLDRPESLIIEAPDALLHLAPPPPAGAEDPRTANLLTALERCGAHPARVVYVSTSGVYGNCGGAWVEESRPVAPQTDLARRRVDAEQQLRHGGWRCGRGLFFLRRPGFRSPDRLPLERLRPAVPALAPREAFFSSHIHPDDLARAAVRALDVDAPVGV